MRRALLVDAESGALDRAPLDAIRAANPRGLLLAYLTSEEIPRQPDPAEQPLAAARLVDDEHMKLVAISGNTLTVQRGFESTPAAHAAGARVASHVVFFAGTWMLDRDGVADDPAAASRQWSAGMELLVDELRARLGPNVPIVSNPGAQDCPHAGLDGILMEGWPIGMPPGYLRYATGAARYARWSPAGRRLTIANGFSPKIGFGTIHAGDDEVARTDYAAMRFGLTSALMGDGLYTYDNGVFGHYVAWWYDEYDGAGRGPHWLGKPLGPAVSAGALRWRELEHGLAVVNTGTAAASFTAPPGFAKLAGTQDPAHNDGKPVTGPLTVAPRDGYVLVRVAR